MDEPVEEKKEEIVKETPAETPETPAETPVEAPIVEGEEVKEEIKEEEIKGMEGVITIRAEETGDRVYAAREKKRYWVKNPESLKKMGFYLGQEKRIPFSELLEYQEGEPIDLTVPDAVYPWEKPEVEDETPASEKPYKVWS